MSLPIPIQHNTKAKSKTRWQKNKTNKQKQNYKRYRHFCGKSLQGMQPRGGKNSESTGWAQWGPTKNILGISHYYWMRRCRDRQKMMPMPGSLEAQSKNRCSWKGFIGRTDSGERKWGKQDGRRKLSEIWS